MRKRLLLDEFPVYDEVTIISLPRFMRRLEKNDISSV